MKLKFISTLKESLISVAKRFPVALAYIVALTVLLFEMICQEEEHWIMLYFLSAGFLFSLMIHLWGEEIEDKRTFWSVMAIGNILLAIDAFYLNSITPEHNVNPIILARLAVYVAFTIGCIYLQFWKNKDDMETSYFGLEFAKNILTVVSVSIIMTIGLEILFFGSLQLFNISYEGKWAIKVELAIAVIMLQFLASVIILSRIPQGEIKHNRDIELSKFYISVLRYLFIPLIICYMVVLYVYMFKIILTWELPQGTLTKMVSIMMFGLSIVIVLLYPVIKKGGNNYERFVARWLPLIALPLVILMTVGIVRRLSDYGITANRLYVLTLNIWFYLVCIGLFLSRTRRIYWVPVTFGILFLLSSAQPLNYIEIEHRIVKNRLNELLADCRPDTTITDDTELAEWLRSIPDTTKSQQIYEDMVYLNWNRYKEDLEGLVSGKLDYLWGYEIRWEEVEVEETFLDWQSEEYFTYSRDERNCTIPKGYNHVKYMEFNKVYKLEEAISPDGKIHFALDSTMCNVPNVTFDTDTIAVREQFIKPNNEEMSLQVTDMQVKTYKQMIKIDLDGYLFYNE
ncbi:MAG: DUF4153 domain-containing protein [Bacteroidales bacterium]|nr:DUF4153 domain-containing protein [Bacteroidales bacterium]